MMLKKGCLYFLRLGRKKFGSVIVVVVLRVSMLRTEHFSVSSDFRARSSPLSFAFAFDDYDFIQICKVFLDLFLSFSFLSSSAEAFTLDHKSHTPVLFFLHILSSRPSTRRIGKVFFGVSTLK
jgi:hypothetical protein